MEYTFREGQYIRGRVPYMATDCIPSVFDYVEYEFNEQSVWELFLLHDAWRHMPLWWHAGYARREYIFERADLERKVSRQIIDDWTHQDITQEVAAYINDDSILPKVTMQSGNEADITICYWNGWRGLVKEVIRVKRENGTTTFTDVLDKTLVAYDCGLRY